MFVDASAFLAILLNEPEAEAIAKRLSAGGCLTSPLALFEVVALLMSRKQIDRYTADASVSAMVEAASISVIPITPEIGRLALAAFERYGKGRGHPAQLNMGDCFAYACAQSFSVPLLYKGDDFARTDIG